MWQAHDAVREGCFCDSFPYATCMCLNLFEKKLCSRTKFCPSSMLNEISAGLISCVINQEKKSLKQNGVTPSKLILVNKI